MSQQLFIGESAINSTKNFIESISHKTIFLVRGKRSYDDSGAKKVIETLLAGKECEIIEFYNFEENPKYEDMLKGIAQIENLQPDLVIAIGGGSVMDMAKLIRFFYSYTGDPTKTEFIFHRKLIPLITIPTTAGTGSEATHFAVLYKDHIKLSVAHSDILPDVAVVNARLTDKASPYLSACTGFDALAQAFEAFWNVNATDESDLYATKAIKLIFKQLPQVTTSPNTENRNNIAEGAYWAGRAINITKTTAPHAFSYAFTTYYGIPHGHAVALTFPYIAELNLQCISKQKADYIYNIISELYPTRDVQNNIIRYIISIGLQFKLPTPLNIELIVSNLNLDRLGNNPAVINRQTAINILKALQEQINRG